MALWGQNHGVYRSKVWHFWVVTHGVLATPDYKTTSQRDKETFASQDYNETTATAGGASQELWNYGTTERASRLKAHGSLLVAQSLSLPSIPFRLLSLVFRRYTAKHKRSIRGSRLSALSSWLKAHSPITLYTLLSGAAVVLPQPPKFLDATLKFLDVIVVKREGKYKNIGSFTQKHRIFLCKR